MSSDSSNANSNVPARLVKCPTCRKQAKYTPGNPYRPFCSERCKLIDLGAWAEEKYAIPVVRPDADTEAESNIDPDRELEDD